VDLPDISCENGERWGGCRRDGYGGVADSGARGRYLTGAREIDIRARERGRQAGEHAKCSGLGDWWLLARGRYWTEESKGWRYIL
jgi:hypothetical protein